MTIRISKSAINVREALSSLKRKIGLIGSKVLGADTADEYNSAVGAANMSNTGAVTLGATVLKGQPVSLDATTGTYGPTHPMIETVAERVAVYDYGANTNSFGCTTNPTNSSQFLVLDSMKVGGGVTNANGTVTNYTPYTYYSNSNESGSSFVFYERRSGKFALYRSNGSTYAKVELLNFANPITSFNIYDTNTDGTLLSTYNNWVFYSHNAGLLLKVGSNNILWTRYWNGSTWVTVQTNIALGFIPQMIWDSPTDSTKFKLFDSNGRFVECTFNSSNNTISVSGITTQSGVILVTSFGTSDWYYNHTNPFVVGYINNKVTLFDYTLLVANARQLYDWGTGSGAGYSNNTSSNISSFDDNAVKYPYTDVESSANGSSRNLVASLGSNQYLIVHYVYNWYWQDPSGMVHLNFVHYNANTNKWQSVGEAFFSPNTSGNFSGAAWDSVNGNVIATANEYRPDYDEATVYSVFKIASLTNIKYPLKNFVGVAQQAGGVGSSVRVTRAGGVSNVHSGLTPTSKYYVNSSSNLSTSLTLTSDGANKISSNYIGTAISDTELIVGKSPALLSDGDIGSRVVSNATNANQWLHEAFWYDSRDNVRLALANVSIIEDFEIYPDYYGVTTKYARNNYWNSTTYTLPSDAKFGTIRIFTSNNPGTIQQQTVISFIRKAGVGGSYTVVSDNTIGGSALITPTALSDAGVLTVTRTASTYSQVLVMYGKSS